MRVINNYFLLLLKDCITVLQNNDHKTQLTQWKQ